MPRVCFSSSIHLSLVVFSSGFDRRSMLNSRHKFVTLGDARRVVDIFGNRSRFTFE